MGDLLKSLTAMSVATTLDGHAPNSTRPYTQTAPLKQEQTTKIFNSEGLDAWASKLDQWGTKLNELKSKPTNSTLSAPTLGLPSKTQGLNFNDTRAVQRWLTDNGFNTKGIDGMYGANTKAAIDELLSSNDFILTQAEKEAFRNFQNNATFVRAKQPAKVETPVVEQPIQNLSQQTIVEEKPVLYDVRYIPGQGEVTLNPETQNNSSTLGKVSSKQNHWGYRWAKPFEGATGLGKNLHDAFIWMGDNGMFLKKPNYGGTGALHKQGGTLIKKHQQGGNMEQQEQQEFMKFLIEDALAQGLQIQTEDDVKSYLSQLGEEGIKAKYLQFMQMKSQTPSAKLGSKLNYIKSLKGDCPDDEEVVYFKKGGMICKACEKKKQGAKLEQSKINPVEEFKKGRKTKKC